MSPAAPGVDSAAGTPAPGPAPASARAPGTDSGGRPRAGVGRARVEVVAGRSVVTSCYATSPMKLLTPREPRSVAGAEGTAGDDSAANPGAASVCVSGFGGGLLSGDELSLELSLGPGARAVLSTQASTKVFHANAGQRPARQTLRATVAAGGLLAAVPDPLVCFRDAWYEQKQCFELGPHAGLILLDTFTAGRLHHGPGERWAFRRYASRNRVWVEGEEVLHDALVLDAADGQSSADGLSSPASGSLQDVLVTGGFGVFATLFFVGSAADHPAVEAWEATVRGRRPRRGDAFRLSAGRLAGSGVRVARFAAAGVEALEAELALALALLPPLVGRGFGERKF